VYMLCEKCDDDATRMQRLKKTAAAAIAEEVIRVVATLARYINGQYVYMYVNAHFGLHQI
jgi:thymidine kinase